MSPAPKLILVVDDEESMRHFLSKTLRREGYDVVVAKDGPEASALAQQRPPDLALVDVRMPVGIDGIETITRLWNVDNDLQVILCTAYSDHAWGDVQREVDAHDRLLIIKKPFDPIEVSQAASALCTKWGLAREVESRVHAVLELSERLLKTLMSDDQADIVRQIQIASRQTLDAVNGLTLLEAGMRAVNRTDPQ